MAISQYSMQQNMAISQYSMQHSPMEGMCVPGLQPAKKTDEPMLVDSEPEVGDMHCGRCSLLINKLNAEILQKTATTKQKQDEAGSGGVASPSAIMPPTVPEFGTTDIKNFAVYIHWDDCEMDICPMFHAIPSTHFVTINCKMPVDVFIKYRKPVPYPKQTIGIWNIQDAEAREERHNVRLQINIDNNGNIKITSAILEKIQTDRAKVKLIELRLKAHTCGLNSVDLENNNQQDDEMIGIDCNVIQRIDAKNALEEFVYDMRSKLQVGGSLKRFVLSQERPSLIRALNLLELFVYEKTEITLMETVAKIEKFKNLINPIKQRADDYEQCSALFKEIEKSVLRTRRAVYDFHLGVEELKHVDSVFLRKLFERTEKANQALKAKKLEFGAWPLALKCPIDKASLQKESQLLKSDIDSVLAPPK